MASTNSLSEREAQIYDRQIRVWGAEVQSRMRNSKVLIAGMNGIGSEVAKNVILSGINVIIADGKEVTEENAGGSFFVFSEDVGQNMAEASLPRVQELNVLASASALPKNIEDISDDELNGVTCAVICDASAFSMPSIAKRLRDLSIPHIFANSCGTYAFFFVDFLQYDGILTRGTGDEVVNIPNKFVWKPFSVAVSSSWTAFKSPYLTCPATLAYLAFFRGISSGVVNSTLDRSLLAGELLKIAEPLVEERNKLVKGPQLTLKPDVFDVFVRTWGIPFVPSSAILGGVIGQDIVKLISRKDSPINNLFVFDAMNGTGGTTLTIPPFD